MNVPLESIEQETLANWLRAHNYMFYKSPSETYTTSWNAKRKNKLEWVTKGFPDTVIILKKGSLLFIELKRQRRKLKSGKLWESPSKVSPEQLEWEKELNNIDNVQCEICYGATAAIETIIFLENEW